MLALVFGFPLLERLHQRYPSIQPAALIGRAASQRIRTRKPGEKNRLHALQTPQVGYIAAGNARKPKIAEATLQARDELKMQIEHAMHRLLKRAGIAAGFFRAPACAYAAS